MHNEVHRTLLFYLIIIIILGPIILRQKKHKQVLKFANSINYIYN